MHGHCDITALPPPEEPIAPAARIANSCRAAEGGQRALAGRGVCLWGNTLVWQVGASCSFEWTGVE